MNKDKINKLREVNKNINRVLSKLQTKVFIEEIPIKGSVILSDSMQSSIKFKNKTIYIEKK